MIVLLFVMLFLLIGIGFSIWSAMGVSGLVYILIRGEFSLKILASHLVSGIDSMSLVSIPFFMLAGALMNEAGITKKLAEFAEYFVGRFKGGLAFVAIVVNIIMAGVSGSAVADASAVSSVLLPTMEERGYDKPFAASINAAAAVIGPIIPPSIPMVFIGVISGISIGKLFLGGVIPGLMMGLVLSIMVVINCRKKDYPVVKKKLTAKTLRRLLKDTFLAIIAPLIIILGIILLISLFVYKSIKFKDIPRIFAKAGVFSASIMIIFAVVGIYQYIVAFEQVGIQLGNLIDILHLGKFEFLILANLFFLFMGCILDAVPVMLIFFPVLLPIALQLGIDATHFGVIVVINLMIGLLTPPIGALLFLEAKIANIEFGELIHHVWPYTLSLIFVLLLCTFVPQFVTWVPDLFFK